MPSYQPRVIDTELDALIGGFPAIAIEGPNGVGKTSAGARRARTTYRLDLRPQQELLEASPERLMNAPGPVLLDEWQRWPRRWDLVRRAVDDGAPLRRFLLTGSAATKSASLHSGVGRIVMLRMRSLSIAERGLANPTVRLSALLRGHRPAVDGACETSLGDYLSSLLASGLPSIHGLAPRTTRAQLGGDLTGRLCMFTWQPWMHAAFSQPYDGPQRVSVPDPPKLGTANQHALLNREVCWDRTGDLPHAKRFCAVQP